MDKFDCNVTMLAVWFTVSVSTIALVIDAFDIVALLIVDAFEVNDTILAEELTVRVLTLASSK